MYHMNWNNKGDVGAESFFGFVLMNGLDVKSVVRIDNIFSTQINYFVSKYGVAHVFGVDRFKT